MTEEALLNFVNNAFFPVLKGKEKGKIRESLKQAKNLIFAKILLKVI